MSELAFVAIILADCFEQVFVEILPVLEGKMLAEDTGRNIQGDECRLNQNCSRTAHRVVEVTLSVPACEQEHTCGQSLVDRSFGVRYAPSAFVQTIATTVQRDGYCPVGYMHVDVQIGLGDTHARTFAVLLVEAVGYGILDLVGHITRMLEGLRINRRVNTERCSQVHVLLPINLFDLVVHLIGIACTECSNRYEHARGGTQPKVGTIEHALVACECYGTTTYLDVVATECGYLARQHLFQTLEGLGYHGKFATHTQTEYAKSYKGTQKNANFQKKRQINLQKSIFSIIFAPAFAEKHPKSEERWRSGRSRRS